VVKLHALQVRQVAATPERNLFDFCPGELFLFAFVSVGYFQVSRETLFIGTSFFLVFHIHGRLTD